VRPGESLDSARNEAQAIWSNYRADFLSRGGVVGPLDRNLSVDLRSIARGTSRVREQFQTTLLLLFGGAGLVLVMVSINVGGMFLARIVQSRKDTAVRRAIGATRSRIVRQWTIESVLVTTVGGIAGLALAGAALPALVDWLSPLIGFGGLGRAPTLNVPIDIRLFAFGVVGILSLSVVAAAIPTVWWMRRESYRALKAAPDDRDNRRIQAALSIVQVAVCTTLLLGGGLLIRTLDELGSIDTGFDRELLVRFGFDTRLAGYDGPATAAFQQRLLEEAASLPGVASAAFTGTPVMQGIGTVMVVARPGQIVTGGAWNTNVNRVSAGYFETMGLQLISGTIFEDRSLAPDEPRPVVVNQAFADSFFGDENPLGGVFDSGAEFGTPTYRIVGVVSDANYRSLREFDPPIFYTNSRADEPAGTFSLVVRTASPGLVVEPVRATVRSIDPAMPVIDAITMSEEVERSLWRERLATGLVSSFAVIGLAVAAMGLYAILAQFVASRRREIGLRLALGAKDRDVIRLIARRVATVIGLGLLLGVAAHLALGRWLSGLLYGVELLDPPVLAIAATALVVISLLAGMAPVRRAVSIDPMSTLREE
jgi:predicted permease